MSGLADLGVAETAAEVRAKRTSAAAIARATLDRIEKLDPQLGAYWRVDGEAALAAAGATDKAIADGRYPGPLAGVTFGAKDLFDIAGQPTPAGSKVLANAPPATDDAFAVAQMRRAGAVLMGRQAMDEFAYGFTTENAHYPPTRNPHDPSRVAGGSSGGSAAATAAGLCATALGSDTNGSVRVPASFCGVFGIKPTFGRLSRRGVFPFVHSLDHVGCFARSVEDLALVYDALQGEDDLDSQDAPTDLAASDLAAEAPLSPAVLGGYFRELATPAALAAVDHIAEALKAAPAELPEAALARSAAFCLSGSEGGSMHLDRLRTHLGAYDPNVGVRLVAGAMLPAGIAMRAQRFRRRYRDGAAALLAKHDVLIAPATPFPAPKLGQAMIDLAGRQVSARANAGALAQPISFIGLPVIAVPVAGQRLPMGVQLIGAPWAERKLFRIARHLEDLGLVAVAKPSELIP